MHLTCKKFIFCKCLVQVWDFRNSVSWHCSQKQPHLHLFFSEQLPSLCWHSCFCSWLVSLSWELIWQKTKPFSFSLSKFSAGLVSSHLCFSTAFSTTVDLRLCSLLEILKWDWIVILGMCYSTTWLRKTVQYQDDAFHLAPCRGVNTWSWWALDVHTMSGV